MAEKRQKKQAAKAFEKETFSKDKEVTGVKHIEHRQDNTFSVENQFSASEKPVSNLPRDANHGSRTGKATSGHSVQKSEFNTGTEYRKNNKKKYYRQQQQDTSGHSVQKSEAEAEKTFLKENSFINEENGNATNFHTEDADSFQDNYHVRNTYQRSEEKGKYHKRRVQREHAHRERAKSENAKQSDYGDLQTKDATFSQGQADEFTDQKVQKAFDKSEKNRRKLQKAKDKMPTKRQYEMKRVFDEQTGKAKYVVVPVDVEKPFKPDGLGKTAVHKLQTENMYFVHRKIAETEKDNSAVEGAHKTEQRAEDIYHYMKYHRKSKAQRKRDRLERLHKKQVTADMKLEYEKFISENPHLKGNSPKKQLQRQLQKQRIKREYAKARRVGAEAKTAKETFTKTANAATGIAKKLQEIATKNKTLIITVGIFALLLIMIMSALSSCGSMFTGTVTTTMASTYLSLPAEIDAADLSFTEKEMELQNKIDRIETDYPGYDEYDYNLGAIGHDPYTLISYLSAVHTEFTAAGIESEIQELFDAMYSLTTEEVEETRTRTVTKTGTRIVTNPDGTTRTEEYEYEEEEEYTVTILRVTLTVTPLESIVAGRMDSEQTEIFGAYTETKGGLQVFASPVDYYWYYYISSYYGYRKNPNTGAEELHRGVDIAVPTGTFVYAAHDGTVTEATYDSYYGNYVVITDSKGYTTKYAHMDSLNVSAGQSVKKGDNIGKSGNTGSSTGSHLHIECLYNGEYYNPLFYFEAGEQTIYGETTGGTGGGTSNVIPPESYDDVTVQTLMREANRYLGMPYTFGGTAPASFDCSGFVCWVFSNSGVHKQTLPAGFYVSPTYSTLLEGAKKARGEKSTARDFASRDGQDTVNLPGNRMTDIYFIEFDEEGRMSQPNAPTRLVVVAGSAGNGKEERPTPMVDGKPGLAGGIVIYPKGNISRLRTTEQVIPN